ncbi:MAG: WG repeat-containing protein [Chitinophagaceae bacterium]|nr:WG repeat-containing protein [Chitinophagaceae bacterium]
MKKHLALICLFLISISPLWAQGNSKKYDSQGSLFDGYAQVLSNGKWGYIDKNCREAIPCIYDEAHGFSEDWHPLS